MYNKKGLERFFKGYISISWAQLAQSFERACARLKSYFSFLSQSTNGAWAETSVFIFFHCKKCNVCMHSLRTEFEEAEIIFNITCEIV